MPFKRDGEMERGKEEEKEKENEGGSFKRTERESALTRRMLPSKVSSNFPSNRPCSVSTRYLLHGPYVGS